MIKKDVVNHNSMKYQNQLAVLNVLLDSGEMSRADLTKELKCDGTTITKIVRELMAHDLVASHGEVASLRPGRPKELIALNATAKYIIGLSFDPRSLNGIIIDLTGKIIARKQHHYPTSISRNNFLEAIEKIVSELARQVPRDKLLGIGIATFGPRSIDKNVLDKVTSFPAATNLDLKKFIDDRLGMLTQIIDGSFAKTMTELWHDQQPERKKDFLLIDAGIGLGAVIVKNGQLIKGQDGCVGEFGHMVLNPNGKSCQCGLHGCLETIASIPAIESEVSSKLGLESCPFESVVKKYHSGNPEVKIIIDKVAESLGLTIGNLVNLLMPAKIIFSGTLMDLGNNFFCQIQKNIEKYTFPLFRDKEPIIQQSVFGDEAAALGGAIILLREFFAGKYLKIKKNKVLAGHSSI